MIEKIKIKCKRELNIFNYDFNGSIYKEIFIINPKIKYNIKNDIIY